MLSLPNNGGSVGQSHVFKESIRKAKETMPGALKDLDTKPQRPLTAYNFFFRANRKQILDTTEVRPEGKPRRSHGKIGFADLARTIAARWKAASSSEKSFYEEKARVDKERYYKEMDGWKKRDAIALPPDESLPMQSNGPYQNEMETPITKKDVMQPAVWVSATPESKPSMKVNTFEEQSLMVPLLHEEPLPPDMVRTYNQSVQQFCRDEYQRLIHVARAQYRCHYGYGHQSNDVVYPQEEPESFAGWPEAPVLEVSNDDSSTFTHPQPTAMNPSQRRPSMVSSTRTYTSQSYEANETVQQEYWDGSSQNYYSY